MKLAQSYWLVAYLALNTECKWSLPIDTHFYFEQCFQTINPTIRWDETNFLPDLAGPIALCDRLTRNHEGKLAYSVLTSFYDPLYLPSETDIHAYYAKTEPLAGYEGDAQSVDRHAHRVMERKFRSNRHPFHYLRRDVRTSNRFGCSVEPACDTARLVKGPVTIESGNYTVIVCIFAKTTRTETSDVETMQADHPGHERMATTTPLSGGFMAVNETQTERLPAFKHT